MFLFQNLCFLQLCLKLEVSRNAIKTLIPFRFQLVISISIPSYPLIYSHSHIENKFQFLPDSVPIETTKK